MSRRAPASSIKRRRRGGRAVLASLVLAACAAQPDVETSALTDGVAARRQLEEQVERGPVPIVILGDLPGAAPAARDRLVAEAMARGVRGIDVTFAPGAAAPALAPRLVVVLEPGRGPPETLCRDPEARAAGPGDRTLTVAAAYCRGEAALNTVQVTAEATSPSAVERLLWRSANALFPDDYAETYGFDILPDWLDLGIGGSFGF